MGGMEGQWETQHENRTTTNNSILGNIVQSGWLQLIANIFENNTTHWFCSGLTKVLVVNLALSS